MMVEFKWISLFLPAVLQFTAAAGKLPLSFTVRVGDDVTLPCENVIDGQQKCEYTTWLVVGLGNKVVKLFELGQIHNEAKSKSDRLSVTENCSLVIKKVTFDDVGYYTCRQNKSGQPQALDFVVHLSVINMTEHKDADEVTLNCSVLKYEQSCRHTVKWLYEGKDVDKYNKDMKTSQSVCYAAVSFLDSHFSYKSKSNLKCEVTDGSSGKVQLFTFSPQSSGLWLKVFLGVAALLITVVIFVGFIRWKKTKGKKPQMDENTGRSLNPAVSPESSQDTADPEDGVSYASISYTRKTNSKGRVLGKDGDDEDDAVTYSSVKASSSSAGASADPSDLYATVNKPNK